jgi:hypothetical protein
LHIANCGSIPTGKVNNNGIRRLGHFMSN